MRLKTLVSVTFILSSMVFISSCGKDKNKVNSNTLSTVGTSTISVGTNPLGSSGLSAATVQAINTLESKYACPNGGARIYKRFYTNQASGNMTTITADFTDGYLSGATDGAVFVGVNYSSRDLIYMQKVVTGTQVTGYNAVLSFCPIANVIAADRNLTKLRVQNMTMTSNTYTGYGTVDNAATFVYSVKDASQTSYYPFGCGGNYAPQNPYLATYGICTNFARPQP